MIALLDANVLYPAPVRDLLLSLAANGLFQPKWSVRIHEEWTRNLIKNRPDLKEEALQKTVAAMDTAFPDAMVTPEKEAEKLFEFPDQDDAHVAAAALIAEAHYIVTNNIKDFPSGQLGMVGLLAITPDAFVCLVLESDEEAARDAFESMVARLRNPIKTPEEVLAMLKKCGLPETAARLAKQF